MQMLIIGSVQPKSGKDGPSRPPYFSYHCHLYLDCVCLDCEPRPLGTGVTLSLLTYPSLWWELPSCWNHCGEKRGIKEGWPEVDGAPPLASAGYGGHQYGGKGHWVGTCCLPTRGVVTRCTLAVGGQLCLRWLFRWSALIVGWLVFVLVI